MDFIQGLIHGWLSSALLLRSCFRRQNRISEYRKHKKDTEIHLNSHRKPCGRLVTSWLGNGLVIFFRRTQALDHTKEVSKNMVTHKQEHSGYVEAKEMRKNYE